MWWRNRPTKAEQGTLPKGVTYEGRNLIYGPLDLITLYSSDSEYCTFFQMKIEFTKISFTEHLWEQIL